MGKSLKKTLKAAENKNGKNKECESKMEKSKEKTRRKRRSFWSMWSAIFGRWTKLKSNDGWKKVEQETQIPMVVNTQTLEMERWRGGGEESINDNPHMLNIPIEPGRQLSTIILSPTRTGFKAVIAHYGINTSLTQSLTKDISAQFENRRTLTLVFDMNTSTYDDVAVGKSESTLAEAKQSESGRSNRSMSASALFVRTGADDIVESAAFLQAQLSLDNATPVPPLAFTEEKPPSVDRRHLSCRSLQRARVAFKTISEPLWQDKMKMRKEMVMKENIQEMLNQFIFLDRDDSLMNYPRLCEEIPSETDTEEPVTYNVMELLQSDNEEKKTETKKMSFSFDRLSELTPSSVRNVAPNLLVNIKPFKEYVSGYQKLDIVAEKPISRNEKSGMVSKRPAMMLGPPAHKITHEKTLKQSETDIKLQRPHKSRLSMCIRCGLKARGDDQKLSNRKREGQRDLGCKRKNSLKMITETNECTLCSAWKMYNKMSFTSVSLKSDSIENILKELDGYDHNSMFKKNLSQFKTKIKPRSSPIDFKTSHSSLSFAEVIELEEGKLATAKNSKTSVKSADIPKVTLRLIEFVRRTGDKTVQFQRIKKSLEKLEIENVFTPNAKSFLMENSNIGFTFSGSNHQIIKVMAQKVEESIPECLANVGDIFVPQETVRVIFPAFTNLQQGVTRHHSENKLEEFKGGFPKRSGQIPDLISYLWMDKIDDLRKELITRMNETRMFYDSSGYHSAHQIRQKTTSSVATTTSRTQVNDAPKSEEHPELPSAATRVIEQEESVELHAEDLQSTGPNDQIFSNPDFKIHSCLTFFVPFVQQIQTAVEILNSAIYSFPVRKVDDQIDKDYVQRYSILSDKKRYFVDNDLESLILKKCIEKNKLDGLTTSKKEITTIKGSKSGNHLVVTNKKILTTNDRIKKSEVLTGDKRVDEDEDSNGIHYLYYKDNAGESSQTSNSYSGKVCGSHSSELVLNPGESDSLQGRDGGECLTKSHSVNLLQKAVITRETNGEGDESIASVKGMKSQPPRSQIESVKVTEEKLIINEEESKRVMVHEKVKASNDKIIRKIGEGVTTQRLVARKVAGKIFICRGDNIPQTEKPNQSKRMSVVVTLSRHTSEKKTPSKCHATEHRARGLIKTVEAKSEPKRSGKTR